ncbi:StAR-related lipid transfer protein 9 [Oopsacas minuta]|uniref:StAR-related lipid transfer protein 9 n=1 Tax=Oopsacas minuta TaxID=111878 RepID=A0AAV7JBC8_9METZ|nr:StAR-related lipid transfer protein 9 [Oopsacas minuta]
MAAKLSVDIDKSSLTSLLENCTEKFLKYTKATEADGWKYVETAEGVEVWKYTPTDGSPTNGLSRGRVSVNVPAELAWRYAIDARNNMAMDSHCTGVELLQEFGPELYIYRVSYTLPWPIAPRELIVAYKCTFIDPKTRLTMYTSIPDDFVPVTPGSVRSATFGGTLNISNEANTSCELITVSSGDLKGYLPTYLINAIITRRPYLLSNVRDLLESHDPNVSSKYFFIEEAKLPKL